MHANALFATDPAEELTLLSQTPVARLIGGGKGRDERGGKRHGAQRRDSPAKMAQPNKIPFGLRTVGPKEP